MDLTGRLLESVLPRDADKETDAEIASTNRRRGHRAIPLDRPRVMCAGSAHDHPEMDDVNVAMPSIPARLHFRQSNLAWVVNDYLIHLRRACCARGDGSGEPAREVEVFLIASRCSSPRHALCGAAQSQTMLIAARFVQGLGGALPSAGSSG